MIQRVQSLYLFLVVVLMSFMPFSTLVEFDVQQKGNDSSQQEETIKYIKYTGSAVKECTDNNCEKSISTWTIIVLVIVIALINFFNIFTFGNRNLQMRICVYNTILMVGLIGLIAFYFFFITNNIKSDFEINEIIYRFALIFPVVGILLNILAFRGIRKDELLVRSYERLRK